MSNTALRAGAGTDTGKQREINEDAYLCHPEEGFFAVFDGVGGYAGGEVAAAEARDAVRRRLLHRTDTPTIRLREAVANANNKIYWRSQEEPQLAGMACVLTVALLEDGRLFAAHVGDTRLYKIRGHRIDKLTRDHSLVGIQEDQQALSEYEAMHHPRRNEILRDVGSQHHEPDDEHFIDIVEAPFEPDCALLLCTDGLTDLVPSRELLRLTHQHAANPTAAAEALIQAANEAGGTDNITVVVVEGPRFGESYPAPPVDTPEKRPSTNTGPDASSTLPPHATQTATRLPRWRYFLYGFTTALALATALYAGWSLWPPAPQHPATTPSVSTVPDTLPGVINALLAAAQPGDTVVVEPGIYRETIRLRSGITLQSAWPDSVRLLPPVDPGRGDTVAVRAEDITGAALIGFTIGPDTTADTTRTFAVGILARRAAVRIDRTTITGTTRAGVDIDAGPASEDVVVLQHSIIANNTGTGVTVRDAHDNVQILDNEIRSNAQAGVLLHAATLELRGNRILDNGGGIALHLDTTMARLRTTNTITQDDVRIVSQENNR